MDVKDIITIMAQTSIGVDHPTETTRKIYLSYLNLYHFELYAKVAKMSTLIKKKKVEYVDCNNNIVITNGDEPLKLTNMFDLESIHQVSGLHYNTVGDELEYKIEDNLIIIDKDIGYFTEDKNWVLVKSTPNPELLTEVTTSEDIPYPPAYQQVLIYGAAYHMYQNEAGSRSSSQMQFNMAKCKEFENNLISYLYRLNKVKPPEHYAGF